jgi:hypothetical protein
MRVLRLLMATALSAAALTTVRAADDQPVVDWIASHAVRLATPEAGHGFDDMRPLKKAIGNARIVSLGEATHGSREFFQLKHRMLEFLATEMGFTIFSIEANMPEAYRLNDFVLTGKGDPLTLIEGMYFWTWNTKEVLDMVLWMREFNKSGKGHVEFTGFDMQTPNVAAQIVRDFVAKAEPEYVPTIDPAYELAVAPSRPTMSGGNFGVATGTFPVKDAAGKSARFSGWIKTEDITRGFAGLWWRVDGSSGVLAFDNMANRAITGTTDWTRYTIELPAAADATNINFGAILPGDGTAWFDDLTVELDGKPYVNTGAFDLDFESRSPVGFYTGGNGYRVALDSAVFHSGKQSLRMTYTGTPPADPKAVDPKLAASTWKEVVAHLEGAREAYRKKDIGAREIEWAVQNARVVVQCMQMRSNEVPATAAWPRTSSGFWTVTQREDRSVGAQRARLHRRHGLYRFDGGIAAQDVRQPDGSVWFRFQRRLVSGDQPGPENPEGFYGASGSSGQPGRDAVGGEDPAVRTRPATGSAKRSSGRVADRGSQDSKHRLDVPRGPAVCIDGGSESSSVLRCRALRGEAAGSTQELRSALRNALRSKFHRLEDRPEPAVVADGVDQGSGDRVPPGSWPRARTGSTRTGHPPGFGEAP